MGDQHDRDYVTLRYFRRFLRLPLRLMVPFHTALLIFAALVLL
jgi:hypothetical protein